MGNCQTFDCEVLTVESGNEVTVGNINVYSPPRVGEYIWFPEKLKGHSSWVVEDVAHFVKNDNPNTYQQIVIYVMPTEKAERENPEPLTLEQLIKLDGKPVVHGQWEHIGELCGSEVIECSNCHTSRCGHRSYCDVCGAKMDGEEPK